MSPNRYLIILLATILGWFTLIDANKIYNLIPSYCSQAIELGKAKEIQLKSTGNESFVQIGASIPQGVEIVHNYKCFIVIQSPINRGLILTVRKASLNDNDTITFRSGSNPDRVWKQKLDEEFQLQEVVTVVSKTQQSTVNVKYEPTVGISQFNAGFDLAVTVYKEKEDTCGEDFDCLNNRCIDANLRCDGYDNCGNNQDEAGCSAISWWIVAILIVVAIVVVVLAILVWVRMSKA